MVLKFIMFSPIVICFAVKIELESIFFDLKPASQYER